MSRLVRILAVASAVLVAAPWLDAADPSTVARGAKLDSPTPKVTAMPADKPGTPGRNYPFFATDIVLANFGYVEEEFTKLMYVACSRARAYLAVLLNEG